MKTNANLQRWVALASKLWPVAKGSLNAVQKKCSRSGCRACASGARHPAWLFTYRQGGKLHSLHVPKDMAPLVRRAIANGRKVEQGLVAAGVSLIKERKRP